MKDTTIAVGLAKNVFEIAISREAGKVSKQLRVSRPKLVSFFAKQSAATVLLEACVSAHFWARTLRRLRHDVVLLPPHLVRPYRRGSKNDRADTKAFARGLPERGDSFGAHQVRAPAHPRRAPSPTLRMALHTEPHASMPYAGSCASSDSSSPRALTSSCPPSPSSSKTLILICPTCSVRTCVMRAPRFESSRTSALASSTSSRRSPSSFLRCNDFSPFPASDF